MLKKPWRTFLDQPFCVATKSHTLKAHRIQNFRHTREKMTTATKTNKRSKKLHNWTRLGFSVPSSRQCDESETTETREKIHVKRNSTNGTEHSEKPSENTEQMTITEAKNQSLPLTLSAIDFHTPQHKPPQNKLIRFAVQLGIMSTVGAYRSHTKR